MRLYLTSLLELEWGYHGLFLSCSVCQVLANIMIRIFFLSLLQKLTKTQDADYIYNFLPENMSRELCSYLHTSSRVSWSQWRVMAVSHCHAHWRRQWSDVLWVTLTWLWLKFKFLSESISSIVWNHKYWEILSIYEDILCIVLKYPFLCRQKGKPKRKEAYPCKLVAAWM